MAVSHSNRSIEPGDTPAILRASLLTGFIALGFQLGLTYVLRGHACYAHSQSILHSITLCTLLLTAVGILLGFSVLRRLPADKDEEGGEPHDRAHFQALLAIGFNAAFAIAILALAIPIWLVQPC